MPAPKTFLALSCAVLAVGCSTSKPPGPGIANVKTVASTFPADFKVTEVGPAAIDPRMLVPQSLPPGVTFQPPDCAQYGVGHTYPPGMQGNMSAVTAEGAGNRFITIAIETSEAIPFDSDAAGKCKHVAFNGPALRGQVDVVDSPQISEARTIGTHRRVETVVNGALKVGELYNYVAYLPTQLIVVTANSMVIPGQPLVPVDTRRAQDLLVAAVHAVAG